MTRTVVVGGGIAGLASAILLAQEGHQVTVLDRNSAPGGRAMQRELGGFRWDLGPSWYLMPQAFEHFFQLCGTSARAELDLVRLDPAYRVFRPGEAPVDVRTGRAEIVSLFEEHDPGSGSRLISYLDEAQQLLRVAESHFLTTTFSSLRPYLQTSVLRHAHLLLPSLLHSLDSYASRVTRHPLLRQILTYPAVFLATHPRQAPSLYRVLSTLDLDDGVWYPQGGMYTVIEAMIRIAERVGVTTLTSTEARSIELDERHRVRAVTAHNLAGVNDTMVFPADVVVGACDLHHLQTSLLPQQFRHRARQYWQRRDPGMGAMVLTAGANRRLPALAHHNLFFTSDWEQNFADVFGPQPRRPWPASCYVSATSTTDPRTAPRGKENLFVLVPVPALDNAPRPHESDQLDSYSHQVWEQIGRWIGDDKLLGDLEHTFSLTPYDFAQLHHAWRGTALGPAHSLKQSAFLRGGVRDRRIGGLFYAGGFTAPGVGLPMCLISAENVLKSIRGDRSSGPLPVEAQVVGR